jgi:hypothetical protein
VTPLGQRANYQQLMTEHGYLLDAVERPAPARRRARHRVRRPVWLAAGAVGAAAAATTAVMALGSAPASAAAYSVTQQNGSVTVAVDRASGVAGANAALQALGARVVVVPVRPGCPAMGSLPHPRPAPHLFVSVGTGVTKSGHRSVTVKLGKPGIPAGDTMILAFSGSGGPGTSLGAGAIITGPIPSCVTLPPAPQGAGPGSTSAG